MHILLRNNLTKISRQTINKYLNAIRLTHGALATFNTGKSSGGGYVRLVISVLIKQFHIR